jgi:hypothetical protein
MLWSAFSRAQKIPKLQVRGFSTCGQVCFVQNENSIAVTTKPPAVAILAVVKFPLNRHRPLRALNGVSLYFVPTRAFAQDTR